MKKVLIILVIGHVFIFIVWVLFFSPKSIFKGLIENEPIIDLNSKEKEDKSIKSLADDSLSLRNNTKEFSEKNKSTTNKFSESLLTYEVELIFQLPEKVILLSLDPNYIKDPLPETEYFNHYRVLGKVVLGSEEMAIILNEVETALYESDQIDEKGCFNPRYGVQLFGSGKKVDFLVSFECLKMQFYSNTKTKFKELCVLGNSKEFNKILFKNKIPVFIEPPTNK